MPWYLPLSASVIVVIIGTYRQYNIGLTMLAGSIALGIIAGMSPRTMLAVLYAGLFNSITIMLVISILLLGVLGYVLKNTGAMEQIIHNLQTLVTDIRVITTALPMIIGMLTVPGGAILSAPFCAEAGDRIGASVERQATINIWFRHVLYFSFPLFPSLVLAAQLSGVSLGRFVLHNLPITLVGILAGFFFLFRGLPIAKGRFTFSWAAVGQLLRSLIPLLVTLILVVFFDVYFPLALLAGITCAILNYLPSSGWAEALKQRVRTMILPGIKFPVALVIAGIMVYKEMLTQSAVISDLTNWILAAGIPILVLLAVVPFLVGMLTGDNSASVAILFPLFMPLLPAGTLTYSAYLAFLYASSTAGHIISPAHPCFSLTKEYHKANMARIISLNLPMLLVVMVTGLVLTALFGIY